MKKKIVIGTRPSKLALIQTEIVVNKLKKNYSNINYEIKKISTKGDRRLDKSLSSLQKEGFFIKEIEIALLNGEIDVAVHSAKDLPTNLPEEVEVVCIADRANPLDTFIGKTNKKKGLKELETGSRLGTGSLRRRSQILNFRNDLEIIPVRGNVETRVANLKNGKKNLDGLILAAAGLERLGLENEINEYITPDICLPAARQGAIALEIRNDNKIIKDILKKIEDDNIADPVWAEHGFLSFLEAGCHAPIGAYSQVKENDSEKLIIRGTIGKIDGSEVLRDKIVIDRKNSKEKGKLLAKKMLSKGADEIMAELEEEL